MSNKVIPKAPFLVIQDFISPLLCEQIVDGMDFIEPDVDKDDVPQLTYKQSDTFEGVLFDYIHAIMPEIEEYYGFVYKGMKPVTFNWYPEDYEGDTGFTCENATYTKDRKWLKNKDRDISAVLFLSEYNDTVPFESDYEVYGGKLEFIQHEFGFQAERGTLILYPSGPHFLNQVQGIAAGDLFTAKFHLGAMEPYLYLPSQFPGDYTNWFETIS